MQCGCDTKSQRELRPMRRDRCHCQRSAILRTWVCGEILAMRRLEDTERAVFREIGTNSLLEFEEGELQWLAEIGSET